MRQVLQRFSSRDLAELRALNQIEPIFLVDRLDALTALLRKTITEMLAEASKDLPGIEAYMPAWGGQQAQEPEDEVVELTPEEHKRRTDAAIAQAMRLTKLMGGQIIG